MDIPPDKRPSPEVTQTSGNKISSPAPETETSLASTQKSTKKFKISKFVKRSTAPYQNLDDINDEESDGDDLRSTVSNSVSQYQDFGGSEVIGSEVQNDRDSTAC